MNKNIEYAGMTVNERLFVAGLLDDFDRCFASDEFESIRNILLKVELDSKSIEEIINKMRNR